MDCQPFLNAMITNLKCKTRQGCTAYYKRLQACEHVPNEARPHSPFVYMGFINSEHDGFELWTYDGEWLESGDEHKNDLML